MKKLSAFFAITALSLAALSFTGCQSLLDELFQSSDSSGSTTSGSSSSGSSKGSSSSGSSSSGGSSSSSSSSTNYKYIPEDKYPSGNAKSKSANSLSKRGICFNDLSEQAVNALTAGNKVVWAYNWGSSENSELYGPGKALEYYPMSWGTGGGSNIDAYIAANPGVQIVLGYNEPNMGGSEGGCSTTPKAAAKKWPEIESLAEKYGVKIGSPAMTYSGATVGGKVYGTPESWLDEFINYYYDMYGKEPKFDYIVLHSYMNWSSAVIEYCNKYAKYYGKPVLLTEFCSWEYGDNKWADITQAMTASNYKFQQRQMVQKLEGMDHNDYVAGYAWFKADGENSKIPWNSLIAEDKNSLSTAGKIYAYLSNANGSKYWNEGEIIPCYEYISSSNFNMEASDPYSTWFDFEDSTDSETAGSIPLQISNFSKNRFVNYLISPSSQASYKLTLHYKSSVSQTFEIYSDSTKLTSKTVDSTNGEWKNIVFEVNLSAGNQTLKIKATGTALDDESIVGSALVDVNFNYLTFSTNGDVDISGEKTQEEADEAEIAKRGYTEEIVDSSLFTSSDNIALGKTAYASSETQKASNATDGNTESRWESDSSDSQTFYVDLEANYTVEKVGFIWEGAYASSYTVDYSTDAVNWTTAFTVNESSKVTSQLKVYAPFTARYVRFSGITRATNYGYSFYEIGVWGSKSSESSSGDSGSSGGSSSSLGFLNYTWNTSSQADVTFTTGNNIDTSAFTSNNLASGKTATASSATQAASNATDGNTGSRWESVQGDDADPSTIYVDLGEVKEISKVGFYWEGASAKTYYIELSDDASSWTKVAYVNSTDGKRVDIVTLEHKTKARYVKMNGTSRTTTYGYSIYEFGVWAD